MTGQVYAVASGKGGVGKTTTVVNLGVALRARDHTVALIDADLGMANLAANLGIDHEPALHDVLAERASIDEALVEEAEGFVVLPGSRELAGFAAADPAVLGRVIGTLAERYEYVLVDTGAGLSYEDVLPLGLVDEIVLVTSPDDAAVGDTKKTAELGDMVGATVRGVVVTYADAETGRRTADEIGAPLLAAVPRDDAVAASTAAGTPLEAHAPESDAATAYRGLAGVLAGEPGDDEAVADESTSPPEEGERADETAASDAGSTGEAADDTDVETGADPESSDDATVADGSARGARRAPDDVDEEEEPDADDGENGEDDGGSDGLLSKVTGLFR